jgi:hypothetical protein
VYLMVGIGSVSVVISRSLRSGEDEMN